jgi:O-antigen/teichoic acid export membrane protein
MHKKFISDLILIVVLNLLIKPIAIFGIDAGVQNRVGTEAYGLYFSLLNLSFIFNIVSDLGINNFTTRNIARYPKVMPKYFGQILGFRMLLFMCYVVLTLSTGYIAGYRGEALYFLSVLILNQLLAMLIAYLRSHFGGLHLFKTDAIVSILDRLLLILLCGSAFFVESTLGGFKIEWFIWMQTISYAITLFIAFVLLVKAIGIPRLQIKRTVSYAILRQSLPFATLVLLMTLYTRSDSVLLERLHPNGAFESGIYAKGFRLLDAFYMFGMIFANLLLPLFARSLKEQQEKVLPLLRMASSLLIGGSILIAFICHFHAEKILGWIYHNELHQAAVPFQLIMWSFIGMSTSLIFGSLLTANGELKLLNYFSLFGVVLNIGLNLLLIPQLGSIGAAISCLITQGVMALVQLILCMMRFGYSLSELSIIRFVLFSAWMYGLQLIPFEAMISLFIMISGGTIGLFLFRLIDLRWITNVFQENI